MPKKKSSPAKPIEDVPPNGYAYRTQKVLVKKPAPRKGYAYKSVTPDAKKPAEKKVVEVKTRARQHK